MLNLDNLAKAIVATEPFPYFASSNLLDFAALQNILADFPDIQTSGVFTLSDLTYGKTFSQLIQEIRSSEFESLIGEKFAVDLSGKPLMITARGRCQKKDGRIHTDSKDKLVTCLLYLNDSAWGSQGGRLRLLRDGNNLKNTIREVSPRGDNFVAFKRSDHSWHGHEPFEGPRRYIMFNWLKSRVTLAKNIGRHKLSAVFKRTGYFDGY